MLRTYVYSGSNIVSSIFIKRNHSTGLLQWSCLQTTDGQRGRESHLVGFENSQTLVTSSVWPSDYRQDDRFVLGPFTALYISFMKRWTLTNNSVRTIWHICTNLLGGYWCYIHYRLCLCTTFYDLYAFLGHRSQRLQWSIVITRCPASVVRLSVVR